jgi:cytochrome c oxidase assembly protein subunit 15
MGLLGLLTWAWMREGDTRAGKSHARIKFICIATLTLVILIIQIALGGWVSTNYAALACADYPLCNGTLVPALDFEHGFTLWRQLGQTANGDYLPFSALVAIHWVHRSFAWIVIGLVVWSALQAKKIAQLNVLGNALLVVIAVQFISGVSTVYFSWPLLIAVLHNAGAALLMLLLCMLNYQVRHVAPS